MRKKEEDQGAKLLCCALGILLGGLLALGVCLLFLLGMSLAISGGVLGMELTYQITIVGCVLGGFCGGALGRGTGRRSAYRSGAVFAGAHPGRPVLPGRIPGGGRHRPAVRSPVRRGRGGPGGKRFRREQAEKTQKALKFERPYGIMT